LVIRLQMKMHFTGKWKVLKSGKMLWHPRLVTYVRMYVN
jgi:hypothetical protein